MKRLLMTAVCSLAMFVFVGTSLAAVAMQVETTDFENGTSNSDQATVLIDGKLVKLDTDIKNPDNHSTLIYRGDRREMVFVEHSEQSYMVMSQEVIAGMPSPPGGGKGAPMATKGGPDGDALAKAMEQIKNLPPEQRKYAEKMLKEKLGGAMVPPGSAPGKTSAAASEEFEKSSDRKDVNGFPTVRYDVFKGGEKIREMWITDWKHIEGGKEVRGGLTEMAGFMEEITNTLREKYGAMADTDMDNPFTKGALEIGMPVWVKIFENDQLTTEMKVKSCSKTTANKADFESPSKYEPRSMM